MSRTKIYDTAFSIKVRRPLVPTLCSALRRAVGRARNKGNCVLTSSSDYCMPTLAAQRCASPSVLFGLKLSRLSPTLHLISDISHGRRQ